MFFFCYLKIKNFCRVIENGKETVTVEENGVLKSKKVNGGALTN